jgi:tetratricopeptide (TPR) repeat protein
LWCLHHGKAGDAAEFLRKALDAQEQTLILWQNYLTALSIGCETPKMLFEADTLLELYAMVPESYHMKAIALFVNGKADDALRVCSDGQRMLDNDAGLMALKSYIQLCAGKKKEEIFIDYVSSPTRTDAIMVRVEWALSQKNWDEAETLLDLIFETPASQKSHRIGSENSGNCWPFFQCVLQKGRLALSTQKNQREAIALLKKYMPESSVALELMGDLYGMQSNSALACFENAMRCASNEQKERLQQKINKLQNR